MWSCSLVRSPCFALGLRLGRLDGVGRFQLFWHVRAEPLPIEPPVTSHRFAYLRQGLLPAPRQRRRTQHQHPFSVVHIPQQAIAFQTQIHHTPYRALDRSRTQRHTPAAKLPITQAADAGMLLQEVDGRPGRCRAAFFLRQQAQRRRHLVRLPRTQTLTQSPIPTRTFVGAQVQTRQRQADVMHRMTEIEHLEHALGTQADTLDHPRHTLPNPRRAVTQEDHPVRLGGPQAVQMQGQQFHALIRPLERPIDPRPRLGLHPPLLIQYKDDQHFRLTPFHTQPPPFLLAFAFATLLADDYPGAHTPAVNGHAHTLATQGRARRPFAGPVTLPVTLARRQHLGSETPGDAMHFLDVQGQSVVGQLASGYLVGGQQGRLAGHPAGQGRTDAFAEAQNGQLRIQAGPFASPAVAVTPPGAAVQGHDPQDQAAQQPQPQRPSLGATQPPRGLVSDFFCWLAPGPCSGQRRRVSWRPPDRPVPGKCDARRLRPHRNGSGRCASAPASVAVPAGAGSPRPRVFAAPRRPPDPVGCRDKRPYHALREGDETQEEETAHGYQSTRKPASRPLFGNGPTLPLKSASVTFLP